jgi:hypothetical protein
MRLMMGIVLACGIALGGLLLLIEPYRREWQAEQQALAEICADGHFVGVATQPVGPTWLRRFARSGRAKYFDRVTLLLFVGSDPRLSDRQRAALKYLQGTDIY